MIEVITFIAVLSIGILVALMKRTRKNRVSSRKPAMSQPETDEIITVILPTINHDK